MQRKHGLFFLCASFLLASGSSDLYGMKGEKEELNSQIVSPKLAAQLEESRNRSALTTPTKSTRTEEERKQQLTQSGKPVKDLKQLQPLFNLNPNTEDSPIASPRDESSSDDEFHTNKNNKKEKTNLSMPPNPLATTFFQEGEVLTKNKKTKQSRKSKRDVTPEELVERYGQPGELNEAINDDSGTVSFATETEQTEADGDNFDLSPPLSAKPAFQGAAQAMARSQKERRTLQPEEKEFIKSAPAQLEEEFGPQITNDPFYKAVQKAAAQFAEKENDSSTESSETYKDPYPVPTPKTETLTQLTEVAERKNSPTTPPLPEKEDHSAQNSPRKGVSNSPQSETSSTGSKISLDGSNDLMKFDQLPNPDTDLDTEESDDLSYKVNEQPIKEITIATGENPLMNSQPTAPDDELLQGLTDSDEEIEHIPPIIEPQSFLQQFANGAWVAFNHPILGPLMMFAGTFGVQRIIESAYRSPRLNKHKNTIDKKVVPLLAQATIANALQKAYGTWRENGHAHDTIVYMPCYAAVSMLGKGIIPVAEKLLRKTKIGRTIIKKSKRIYQKQTKKGKERLNIAAKAYKIVQNAVLAQILADMLVPQGGSA